MELWLTWNLLSTRDWNSLRCSRLSRASFTVRCQLSICFWCCVTARWYRLGKPPGIDWTQTWHLSLRNLVLTQQASRDWLNTNITLVSQKSESAGTICQIQQCLQTAVEMWRPCYHQTHTPGPWSPIRLMTSIIAELKCTISSHIHVIYLPRYAPCTFWCKKYWQWKGFQKSSPKLAENPPNAACWYKLGKEHAE